MESAVMENLRGASGLPRLAEKVDCLLREFSILLPELWRGFDGPDPGGVGGVSLKIRGICAGA